MSSDTGLDIVVMGGGMCGSLAAMLLAKDGHRVTVLERDEAEPPVDAAEAWEQWERRSVRQFHVGHFFLPRFRTELLAELPHVVDELRTLGALEMNPVATMPVELSGGERDGDERFTAITARRPVVEAAVARLAAASVRVDFRRGVVVSGLVTDEADPNHITGVETSTGERFEADLLVDAAGRQSPLPRLLEAAGAGVPVDDSQDCGFIYYGKTFRSEDGSLPVAMGGGLQHYDSISTLTLPADNGTWFCGIVTAADDKEMRKLRDDEVFEQVWRQYPLIAHWHDGQPFASEVKMMAGIEDRLRSFVTTDGPVATGVAAIGDAWACTNPSVGRGASIGFLHAIALRDQLREADIDDRSGFAEAWHQRTTETALPWYDDTIVGDRHRLDEIAADISGATFEPADPELRALAAWPHVAFLDPEVLRGYFDVFFLNRTRTEVLSDEGMLDRILELAGQPDTVLELPGPSRSELLATLAG